jgi:hypothetical protein
MKWTKIKVCAFACGPVIGISEETMAETVIFAFP